ncbi:major facilitator superfamily domain-containing protein [Zychaea mexicana]|uniref:major facilitator superfamily domain-containing protein n=1 Tax=Zychaea mexicana TaxID=64656 RepID=UPI0022FE7256|nr:major facilitator superfamily domain-containing protein [Zychaea mexicana]KAI9497526.1 major facilitator superfamily domain-containing protein [Zychaea mexicana]
MGKEEKTTVEVSDAVDLEKVSSNIESGEKSASNKFVYSPEEKKLVRKINFATVPFICAILFIQFIDKSTLNFSAVLGLYEDTRITGTEFSWLGSIFYVGYLAFQVIPNQYFLQRLPISKYLGSILVVWGACLACMAEANNFAQLAGLRFLLGFWEASTYPSIFLLISTIYRRSEQVVWFGTMFICNSVATSFGGLIGFGMGHMDGLHGLSAWQWCMLIWGVITSALGFVYFFLLPDRAKSRWYKLTIEEEKIVDDRTRDNTVVQNKVIKREHIFEALREPRFYCYITISFLLNLQNGCVTIFSSQIIKSMGFTNLESILLNIPKGFSTILLLVMSVTLSRRFNENGYVGALMSIVSFFGALFLTVIPTGGAMLVGIFLSATSPPYTLLQTMISNNVTGYTKKIFYTGGNLVAYCIGNFVGPLMMVETQAPRYTGGMIGYMVADVLAAALFVYVRRSLAAENRRRQKLKEGGQVPPSPENREAVDLTDVEDLHFDYRP